MAQGIALKKKTIEPPSAALALLGFVAFSVFAWMHSCDELALVRSRAAAVASNEASTANPPAPEVTPYFFANSAASEREEALPQVFSPGKRILLLGSDSRKASPLHGRPDTIMVVVLPNDSSKVGVISLPRDLLIEPLDAEPHRINETMQVARNLDEDPLQRMTRVVSNTLALPIDHTILLSMDGFVKAVDSLGGVDVDVPCPIIDNFVDPSTESGRRELNVEAGRRHMDGPTAAMYARSRHGRSDFGRTRRQQAVLRGMKERLLSPGGLKALPALLAGFDKTVHTDMSKAEIATLAWTVKHRDLRKVHGVVIGYRETTSAKTESGKAVLVADEEKMAAKVAGLFDAPVAGARVVKAPCPDADVALRRSWKE